VLPGNDSFEYTDNVSFRASIPFARKDIQVTESPSEKSHLLSETPDGLTVRFVVRDAKTKDDLFNPGYEQAFLSSCGCAVVRRGVVHTGGFAAREYVVTTDGGARAGYYRHIGAEKKIVLVEVSGPADQETRVQQIFQALTQSLEILKQD
jgi:hypothetical protein